MFHICPQEIMAVMMAVDVLKPYVGIVGHWCKSCVDGTHKSCADHKLASQSSDDAIEDVQNA